MFNWKLEMNILNSSTYYTKKNLHYVKDFINKLLDIVIWYVLGLEDQMVQLMLHFQFHLLLH